MAVGRPWPTLTAIAIALILVVSAGAADFGLPAIEGSADDWVREDFAWSTIEPSRGKFRWARTDALMRNAAQLGLKVLAIATYAPGWATGHPESDKYPPSDPADFARFVSAVTTRYGVRGTFWRSSPRLAPSPLTAIEIWNEPWLGGFWRGGPDPATQPDEDRSLHGRLGRRLLPRRPVDHRLARSASEGRSGPLAVSARGRLERAPLLRRAGSR